LGPAGSGTSVQPNFASLSSEAREIWVIVIADSPAKKSAATPGPGIALSVKIARWMKVIASTIGCWLKPQVLPSALHASAPQPLKMVDRLSQAL
jgi:hypothetical protein